MSDQEGQTEPSFRAFIGDLVCISIALCGASILVVATKLMEKRRKISS